MDAVDWLAIGLAVVFILGFVGTQTRAYLRQRADDRAGLAEAERHRIAAARMRAADRQAWREVGEAASRRNPVEHPAPRREIPPTRKAEAAPMRKRETHPSSDDTATHVTLLHSQGGCSGSSFSDSGSSDSGSCGGGD